VERLMISRISDSIVGVAFVVLAIVSLWIGMD
jgi:hypothetical protein